MVAVCLPLLPSGRFYESGMGPLPDPPAVVDERPGRGDPLIVILLRKQRLETVLALEGRKCSGQDLTQAADSR